MATLKTNYKDDILDTSVNTQRKYRMVNNADGTISLEDVTVYTQNGDSFGAADINKTNQAVLALNSSLDNLNGIVDGSKYVELYKNTIDKVMTVDLTPYKAIFLSANGGNTTSLICTNSLIIPVNLIPLTDTDDEGVASWINEVSYITIKGNALSNMKVTAVRGGVLYGIK